MREEGNWKRYRRWQVTTAFSPTFETMFRNCGTGKLLWSQMYWTGKYTDKCLTKSVSLVIFVWCPKHPDEATDHIIDIGLELDIPWVVIPCCVFPTLFRERRTRDGRLVKSYEDLCDYVLTRHPGIQETTLPFRGRNRVFYWRPVSDSTPTATTAPAFVSAT